jgi:hypothetical protein
MKTTLNLDSGLMRLARRRAAETERTLTALMEDALRELLRSEERKRGAYRFDAKPVAGRVQPGIDLDDRAALMDAMDGRT